MNKLKKQAFTLYDVLIATVVIGLLSAVAVSSVIRISRITEKEKLDSYAQMLNSSIDAYKEVSLGESFLADNADSVLKELVQKDMFGRITNRILGSAPNLDELNVYLGSNEYCIVWDKTIHRFKVVTASESDSYGE